MGRPQLTTPSNGVNGSVSGSNPPTPEPEDPASEPSSQSPGPQLDTVGLAAGRATQRETGRTFHLATRLFPEEIRDATYVLYGFVRIADEIVDGEAERTPAEQAAAIDDLRAIVLDDAPTDEPVLAAFQTVRDAYGIRREDLEAFLDAMAADIDGEGTRYATSEAVDEYIHGSAAAVGHMMTAVMGVEDPAARPHAASLGAAFQLTNFLRDVREDRLELDRIYLPESTLRRHGASHAAIEALAFDDRVAAAVRDELERAEAAYRKGVAGIRYLPEGCQFPVLAAAVLYAEYHRVIRANEFDVVSARPSVGTARKLAAIARTAIHWYRTGDPEAAFYAASAVPQVTDEPTSGRLGAGVSRASRLVSWLAALPGGNHGD